MNKPLSIFVVFLVLLGYAAIFMYRNVLLNPTFGFSNDPAASLGTTRAILLSVFTVLGILAKIIYDEIDKSSDDGFSMLKVVQKAVNSRQAWMALITCPVVILAFYKSLNDVQNISLICLLSFQNGFFFKSVFNKKDQKPAEATPLK